MIDEDLLDKLTTTQLQDLRHRLNQTNESTTVLIPVGARAFREATLRLDRLSWSSNSACEEGGKYVSKDDALKTLQYVISKRLPKTKSANESAEEEKSGKLPKRNVLATPPASPYIEIREEIDDKGRLLRTETVDVTNHLNQLAVENGLDVSKKSDDEEALIEHETQPRLLADEDFNKLSDRLDELAMMEEAGEELKSKPSPQPASSAKPPNNKGWSKGFLNKPKKKKSVSKPLSSGVKSAPTGKAVSFGENMVREIPTEGKQNPLPTRQSHPIESNIFSGVVQERPRKKSSGGSTQPNKKLSRFAQERLQGLR